MTLNQIAENNSSFPAAIKKAAKAFPTSWSLLPQLDLLKHVSLRGFKS